MNAHQEFRLDYDTTLFPVSVRPLNPCSVPDAAASNDSERAPAHAQRLRAIDALALCLLEGAAGG